MNHLIVTVGDSFSGRKFDLEVPKDVESEKLLDDSLETLRGYAPELQWRISEVALWDRRLGRMLKPGETLEEAGVWNGDTLYLAQK